MAIITILFESLDCNKVDADGVKVICPAVIEYAAALKVVPPTVILVIAVLQVELSVKETMKLLSTIAPIAAVNDITGAIRLNVLDVTPVKPALLNAMAAPVTAAALVAVNPLKVVVPEVAPTEVVPPNVQVPALTAAVTEAVLAVVLPY